MKKVFASMVMALAAVAMMAQQPVITFEKTDHDFGKINEADGKVTTIFTFKNELKLVLSQIRYSILDHHSSPILSFLSIPHFPEKHL